MLYCKIEEYIPGKKEKKINKIPKIKYELKLMIKIMSKLANKSFPNSQGTARYFLLSKCPTYDRKCHSLM